MMIMGTFGNGYIAAQSDLEVTFILGSTSVEALVQCLAPVALGWDSTHIIKLFKENSSKSL